MQVEDVEALAGQQVADLAESSAARRSSVPIDPLSGTLKPTPMRRMSPSDARCGPWLAVMIRTSWPRSRRFS